MMKMSPTARATPNEHLIAPGKRDMSHTPDATDLHAQVRARRAQLDASTRHALNIPEDSSELWGLALSGGGIRSATFSLGVIRALADTGVLNRFDLLSTVSGGG